MVDSTIEKDWLDGCVPWDGIEGKLPTGALMPPKVDVLKLIKAWDVLDAESDEGFRTVKTSELKPDDAIIGCTPNNNSIRKILDTYGSDAFRFITATGQKLGPEAWAKAYSTNPFVVLAIMRKSKGEGGVHF
ncbi:hypothetical protein M0R72_12215 [Candidatus Pacearchaeota archaeon]|jgi:hypothetical protein|nr:hypothetical protein [Candidatus Pacearchaeota archaeon]